MDFNISASTLINVKNEKDSSKCTKKFWYDETAATPTCRVNHGVQPTGDVTSAQKALLISNLSALNNWQVGAPTGSCGNCPDGWVYNGKSKCFKVFSALGYRSAVDTCRAAHTTSGDYILTVGRAKLLQFIEDEDFTMLYYGGVLTKCK